MQRFSYRVDAPDVHKRLDVYLAEHNTSLTRSHIKKLIDSHAVTVNSHQVKVSCRLKLGDLVELQVVKPREPQLVAENLPLDILFEDDFSYVLSGWPADTDADASLDYSDGRYEISIYQADYTAWAMPGEYFTDTDIEVEAIFDSGGDDSVFGIICRHVDYDNFYVMVIDSDGYYGIFKTINAGDFTLIDSEYMDYSDAIRRGEDTNRLRAVCDGDRLSLSVNGKLLIEVNDTDLTGGDVGLIVATGATPNTTVYFDNFIVSKP